MSRTIRVVVFAAVALLMLAAVACGRGGGWVDILPDRYIPNLPAELRAYQGYPVYLTTVTNAAPETERDYYFYNADGSVIYEADGTLTVFVHDSFAKAFTQLGMNVILDPVPPLDANIPELQVTVVRWTDSALYFQVVVNKYLRAVYQQEYRVEVPAPATTDSKTLEDAVYRKVDMALTGMLADQGFQAAFFQ
jgi:hypothetical protein